MFSQRTQRIYRYYKQHKIFQLIELRVHIELNLKKIDQHYKVEYKFLSNIKKSIEYLLLDGVLIQLHTQILCQLRAYWFVNIQDFYSELDSKDFRLSLYENRFLKTNSVYRKIYE